MRMKIQLFKIFGMQHKQSCGGNTSQEKPPFKNCKELKYKLTLHIEELGKKQQIDPTPKRRR